MADTTPDLPQEIIELILSKLSLKSLLQFKTVSKSWNTLISDPIFVKNHHQQSKQSNSNDLFLHKKSWNSSDGFSLVRLEDEKLRTQRVIAPPHGWEHVLCFCEGLLLIQQYGSRRLALWNPSTGAEKSLWLPYNCFKSNFGLCRDPITDDFKVVIASWEHYMVYSFKNNSWKKRIKYECVEYYRTQYIPGVCVDGASYWLWLSQNATIIMYFDPRDDKFKILQKTESVVVEGNEPVFVAELRGRLCVYCNNGRDKETILIWTKGKGIDNNSWNKLMNVENVTMPILWFELKCFIGNKIVIRNAKDDRLVVYNPYEKKFEQFEDKEVGIGGCYFYTPSTSYEKSNS
ncbi:hypothetical protein MIMGU_mgv1a022298mg [Erythranthe guttata]|uniref:F-box domain-containing protein n=1 Tax=Erythranthe guttata TaxID=4155 RepID=A0A022QU62_ERYGU|nr:hypothetical protein MIMGU_mgv1a022298mg [Erythranthe guttata]